MNLNNIYERLRTAIDKEQTFTELEKTSFKSLILEKFIEEAAEQNKVVQKEVSYFRNKIAHDIEKLHIEA